MTRWPHAFAPIAKIIGDDAALALCQAYGGVECYVPENPKPESPLVKAIGMEAATALVKEHYGRTKIYPPLMKEGLKAEIAAASGSLTQVARRFNVTRTWVRKIRSGRP